MRVPVACRSRRVLDSTSVMVTLKVIRPRASAAGVTESVVGPSCVTVAADPETRVTEMTENAGSPSRERR